MLCVVGVAVTAVVVVVWAFLLPLSPQQKLTPEKEPGLLRDVKNLCSPIFCSHSSPFLKAFVRVQ